MPETRATATPLQVTAAVVIVLVGVAETWRFLGWNFDDAYIVFRIARNLAAGHGWGFNAGEAHNASTSVLNTLTTAGAAVAFQSIPLAAHWINALWIIASGLIVAHVFARRFPAAEWLGLAAGVGIVCTLAENSTWGLETSLFFFLLMVVVLLEDIGRPSWVAIGLLTLTRPDGALVAGFRWLRGLMHRQLSMKGLAQFLAVLSPWVIYSLVRFHQVFPDTLANKIWQGRSGFWGTGHVYWQALASHVFAPNAVFTAVFVLAVPGMYFLIRDRSALLYVVTLAIAQQAAYGVLNVPGYHWYFATFDAAMVLAACYAVGSIAPARAAVPVFMGIAAVSLSAAGVAVAHPATDDRDVAYRAMLQSLNERGIPPGRIAAAEVGTLGYHLADHPVVDMLGLTSANPEFATGANNEQFFRAAPEIVLLHSPRWPVELAVAGDLRFEMMYQPAGVFAADDPQFTVEYFRRARTVPTPEEMFSYLRAHYPTFVPETRAGLTPPSVSADASCALDTVNDRIIRTSASVAERTRLFSVSGWAVDNGPARMANDISLVLSSSTGRFSMPGVRTRRDDVSAHFKDAGLAMSGFSGRGSIFGVPAGEYRLGLAQARGDSVVYCEFPNVITLR